VISGDGAGDQTVGSPEVKALDGWMQIEDIEARVAELERVAPQKPREWK
jgi:hypothetical protein